MRFTVDQGTCLGEHVVHHTHQDQRKNGNQGMGQFFVLEGGRFIEEIRPVTFTCGSRLAAAALQIAHADNEDENRADRSQDRGSVNIRLEKGGRNDVLDLRRTGQGIHG